MRLHPFAQSAKEAEKIVRRGGTIHQQFLCIHCQTKQTMEEPNTFFTQGHCEECGGITNIEANGCNFLAIL